MISMGYIYHVSYEKSFRKKFSHGIINISMFFSHKSPCTNGLFSVSFSDVENIIYEVGLPNFDSLENYKNGSNFMNTIYDTQSTLKFGKKKSVRSKSFFEMDIQSENDVNEWAIAFLDYIKNDGLDFLNKYTYLPNVLTKIDEIENGGKEYYLDIISGGLDHLFRVLIISKLCNDPKFSDREKYIEGIMSIEKYEMYQYYFGLLKKELEKVEPIYN